MTNTFCLILSLVTFTVAFGAASDDSLPEYESENTATSVREAGAPQPLLADVPRSNLEELQPMPSGEVAQLTALDGETTHVVGTVVSTFVPDGGSPVILNFGDDYRTCFKVVVYRRNYDHWGLNAEEIAILYTGQELLVEGTISLYDDLPQIEAIAPAQLRRVVEE